MAQVVDEAVRETPYWQQPVSIAELIAETLDWATRNPELADPRLDSLDRLLPSGSGIDSGTKIDRDVEIPSQEFRLTADWHAMDSNGYYSGWFPFTVTVVATFSGPSVELEWAGDGKGPEQDYPSDPIPCADCSGVEWDGEGEPCETCDGTGQVADENAEWAGISDPTDYLLDVYREVVRAPVRRIDLD